MQRMSSQPLTINSAAHAMCTCILPLPGACQVAAQSTRARLIIYRHVVAAYMIHVCLCCSNQCLSFSQRFARHVRGQHNLGRSRAVHGK